MQIENTLYFYFSVFEKKNLFKLFPNLKEELLSQYKQIVENSDKKHSNIDLKQEYFQLIKTGIEDDYYTVSWSIRKIDNIVSQNDFPIIDFDIRNIYSDEQNLNPHKLAFYSDIDGANFNPIYVSYYSPINTYIVVDGNHRIKEFRKRGSKTIKGFGISPCYNIEIMNEFSFSIYKFHHNLVSLHRLCEFPFLSKFKVNKNLEPNSFYGNNIKFNFLIFKKLALFLS